MKKIIAIVALVLSAAVAKAQIKSAALTASGLTCSMCSKSIYKSLLKLPSVQDVQTDIEHSIFNITFKPGSKVSPDDVKKAVTDAGFAVASLKMTADFAATQVGNDVHVDFAGNTYHFLDVPQKTLSGEQTFTVVDKNFVSAAAFRKYKKFTAMKCYDTGIMESCCHNGKQGNRIYHITL